MCLPAVISKNINTAHKRILKTKKCYNKFCKPRLIGNSTKFNTCMTTSGHKILIFYNFGKGGSVMVNVSRIYQDFELHKDVFRVSIMHRFYCFFLIDFFMNRITRTSTLISHIS